MNTSNNPKGNAPEAATSEAWISVTNNKGNFMANNTAKILFHPYFDRPAVANPKTARANSKGCINFGRIRHEKRLAEIRASIVTEKPYTLTMEDEIDILRRLATGAIRNLESKFNEIKFTQAGTK